jgi:4-hydroxy-3-methylbut-2-en-1-yl diphosphate synthase IspG/GcpE
LFVDEQYAAGFKAKDFDVLSLLHAVLGLCEAKTVDRFKSKQAASLAQSVVEHLGATMRISVWKAAASVSGTVSNR